MRQFAMGDIRRIYKKYGGKELAVKAPRDARLDTKGLTPEPVEGRMTGVPYELAGTSKSSRRNQSNSKQSSGYLEYLFCFSLWMRKIPNAGSKATSVHEGAR